MASTDPQMLFVSVQEARKIILDSVSVLDTEWIPVRHSAGRILSEPIVSGENIPAFDNSAMDGYAVRTADTGSAETALRLVGTIPCGVTPERAVSAGECMRILTGAQIPVGADAVIQQELVSVEDGLVRLSSVPAAGANIRRIGSNIAAGSRVVDAGVRVTPGIVSILATLGFATVPVVRQPRVAVFSSGDELVDVRETPGPSQLRNSNGPTLSVQVESAGGTVVHEGVLRDTPKSIHDSVRQVLEELKPDMLVVSGGASVGDYDLVREQLGSFGMRVPFWKVRQRPGKPLAFGLIGDLPVFMLPGNPVSASVCFEQYTRPCLLKLLGSRNPEPKLVTARFEGTVAKNRTLHYFARGIAHVDGDGMLRVAVAGAQGSHVSNSLVSANCLIHLPEETDAPVDGEAVHIEWINW